MAYAALASYPIARGHIVVVWKKPVADLGQLDSEEYAYLMLTVDRVRNALMKLLKADKVYLMYMDEIKHVHWHLIPRYQMKGIAALKVKPKLTTRFPLVPRLQKLLK